MMFNAWRPLDEPSMSFEIASKWRALVLGANVSSLPRSMSVDGDCRDGWELILQECLMAKLYSSITNKWIPQHAEPCIQLVENCLCFLPVRLASRLIESVVAPKINKAIGGFSVAQARDGQGAPSLVTAPMHTWVLPWTPILAGPCIGQLVPR
eukprot:GHVN01001654.1.p1 GENE.GHVN01001654.1~~GHVN01001654.1.p1  ORF type:complete len:153 (-),score=15.83 GHVN01001654.1:325-783(-)